mmetsp:Transcript_15267/g.22981  ORF Transcript_15267/g.22981 Transcript_15267/m.22981 type:complete len:542 (-) Transcript_15267:170-1795(-)|eukprot:CAMPEP_0185029144 /NCGR_PEP_ID=MMETSP1103-20130426/15282_1 /TAXON_ID=36769 /ORGANISM="Paraphysomonas bandaiensis, Strain Caron Lab Isolate" /LENGTH=541 /DNA_ID=CAMNT_0027563783 /DNA_START=98 /DNA_END=1723 /DNA_ORIENTATION=+
MNILKYIPWGVVDQCVDQVLTCRLTTLCVQGISRGLTAIGVPENHTPDAEQILLSFTAIVVTLFSYWYWLGRKHLRNRKELEVKLNKAQQIVRDLEEKLLSLESSDLHTINEGKEIRIWMDGAFDMMHYGHMNAFRKGRALGTKLIVGVNSDETITQCKGSPVMNDEERLQCVKGCKFVDEVVSGVPYIMNDEYLQWVIKEYNIDYVVHGDDPCIVDGKDVYESAQKMGKYLTIPRTEGISTTDIVGRMLLMTRSHHSSSFSENLDDEEDVTKQLAIRNADAESDLTPGFDRKSDFLTTSHIIRLFGAGVKAPGSNARVVYVAGSWDMFHSGHVALLEKARKYGDYVIAGVHSDAVVNSHRGLNYPLMNMHERSLSVLGCKYVDDVLLDAPYVITKMMVASLRIVAVVRGTVQPEGERWDPVDAEYRTSDTNLTPPVYPFERDPYALPRDMGILHVVPSSNDLTAPVIVDRIHAQRERYMEKFSRKKVQEDQYYDNLYGETGKSSEAVSGGTVLDKQRGGKLSGAAATAAAAVGMSYKKSQ